MEEALIKRVLPHSLEAEQSVIGSMLMDREAVIAASEIVTGSDFYQQQYGIMFDAMVELFNEGKPVDLVTGYRDHGAYVCQCKVLCHHCRGEGSAAKAD